MLLLFLTSLLFTVGSLADDPNTITITGTIFDFLNKDSGLPGSHPDFNSDSLNCPNPPVKGMVAKTLGADRIPVYQSNACVTSETTFNQWYRRVDGVNLESPYAITATFDPTLDAYTYSNMAFFPIDGEYYGNENKNHNFGFTFQAHLEFTYQKGQIFTFSGDDDVWVFINNQLVIDLGGLHAPLGNSVDLDTLGLTEGETYNFDFFSAERHVTGSTLTFTTSIVLQKPASSACTSTLTSYTSTTGTCPLPQLYCLRLLTAKSGTQSITGCTVINHAIGTFNIQDSAQRIFLASQPDGTQSAYFDELATLTVTAPSGAVQGKNYIAWEADCADSDYDSESIPHGISSTATEITDLFGEEEGNFDVEITVKNKYGPLANSDVYVCSGSQYRCCSGDSLESDNSAATSEVKQSGSVEKGASMSMVIGITATVSVIGTVVLVLVVSLIAYVIVKNQKSSNLQEKFVVN